MMTDTDACRTGREYRQKRKSRESGYVDALRFIKWF